MSDPTTPNSLNAAPAGTASPPADSRAASPNTTPSTPESQSQTASGNNLGGGVSPARPEGLPDAFWDDKAGVKFKELLAERAELSTLKTETDARLAAVPQAPDGYQPALPKDFKLPDNWEIKTDDPMLTDFQKFAHANKFSQDQFSGALAVYAQNEMRKRDQVGQAVAARDAALGQNGPSRVSALHTWFDAAFGADAGREFKQTLFTPAIVAGFEKMQRALTSQGVTSFVQTGRDGGGARIDGKPDNFEKMSPIDRRAWDLQNKADQAKAARR